MNELTKGLIKYVPDGHSPKMYIKMATYLMGTDSKGNPRPTEDLAIFLITCKRTGLDPIAKQIYPIYRWDSKLGAEKLTIQTAIDGFRAVAESTDLYAGSDDAIFEEQDGKPIKATVTVYKLNKITGERMPVTASARWNEYYPGEKNGMMWKKMPYNQLAKCAEALALRKAFPKDLSGVYSEDEMAQSKNYELPTPKTKQIEYTDNEGITHTGDVADDGMQEMQEDVDQNHEQYVSQSTNISQIRSKLKENDETPVDIVH